MDGINKMKFTCCFCKKELKPEDVINITLSKHDGNNGTQYLYCHIKCLKDVFPKDIILYVESF